MNNTVKMTIYDTSFHVGSGRYTKSCPVNNVIVETVNAVIKNHKVGVK